MPNSLLLRFRDTLANTVFEHQLIEDHAGYSWWGWWKKNSEPDQDNVLGAVQSAVRKSPMDIGLFDRSTPQYWSSKLLDCHFGSGAIPSPEPLATPQYYSQAKCAAWFKLKGFARHELPDFVRHFGPIPTGDDTLFVKANSSSFPSAPVHTICIGGGRILHLSDIHFGVDSYAAPPASPGFRKLIDILKGDLRKQPPDIIILSGDITSRGDASVLFQDGIKFLNLLREAFSLTTDRFIIVPGNHDIPLGKYDGIDYSHENAFIQFEKAFFGNAYDSNKLTAFTLPHGSRLEILRINSVRLRKKEEKQFGFVDWSRYSGMLYDFPHEKGVIRLAVLHHHLVSAANIELLDPSFPDASVSTTLDAGEVICGLQKHGFKMAIHGHQHVPAISYVRRARFDDNGKDLVGLDKDLVLVGAGSCGAIGNRLSPEMPENSYNLIDVGKDTITVEARGFTPYRETRRHFRFEIPIEA